MPDFEIYSELARTPISLWPRPMQYILVFFVAFLGASIGSFLNVVIGRLPHGQSVVRPRSRCPKCAHMIAWYDNIPILSWILLRARCRGCKNPISARYPLVETIVMGLALAALMRFGISVRGIEVFVYCTLLVAAAFVDIDTWTIPLQFVVGLLLTAIVSTAIHGYMDPKVLSWELVTNPLAPNIMVRVLGAVLGFLGLWAFAVLSTVIARKAGRIGPEDEAMGLGDPLLFGGIGAVMGIAALPYALFTGSLVGSIVGYLLRFLGKGHEDGTPVDGDPEDWVPPTNAVQFGPFLALGGVLVAFSDNTWLERLLPVFQ